ncbi:MAG: acetate kinase [Ruminococcaceae bacterium]|nr:acetate kinase [Oscillospiraceae bacterium]
MKILVINAGSSSLKYQLINMEDQSVMAKGLCERIGIDGRLTHSKGDQKFQKDLTLKDHGDAIQAVLDSLTDKEMGVIASMDEINAVGHRVVHGGEAFSGSAVITEAVMNALNECIELAPLHNPPNITGIEACAKIMPNVPQVGVFDTAFHQTMPKKAYLYALPYKFYEQYKIRRYGFHGTSHKYVSMKAAEILGKPAEELKIVTCHLGNGSSISAVDGGKSVDTSMGFTPLAGILMGTRSGDIDPAIVEFIANKENLTASEVISILNKESGVTGVSGVSSDFRDLSAASAEGNERATAALDMFAYGVQKYIGTYAAAMGGIDAVVFTAGIGENDATLREQITENLGFMGIKINKDKNAVRGTVDISADDATVKTLVIPTNEELMIALETEKLV